jgi:hypothetical protein
LEEFVSTNFDSIGLFLCIQIMEKYRETLEKRSVPALQPYCDAVQQVHCIID